PQQDHRAYHLGRHRGADPGGVRPDQRVLQLGPPLGCDRGAREGAEAGGHPVHRPAGPLDVVHDGAAGPHRVERRGGQDDAGALRGHGDHVTRLDAGRRDGDGGGFHIGTPLCRTVDTRGTPGRYARYRYDGASSSSRSARAPVPRWPTSVRRNARAPPRVAACTASAGVRRISRTASAMQKDMEDVYDEPGLQSVASATVAPASSSRRASGYGDLVENSAPGSSVA